MNRITAALTKIAQLDGALVDRSFRQGYDAVVEQLRQRDPDISQEDIDSLIEYYPQAIASFERWIAPYHLPDQYRFFLEYSGGMQISTDRYHLSMLGTGPMVEEWYGYIQGDEALMDPSCDGVLLLGSLVSEIPMQGRYPRVYILLDLAGIFQAEHVIGVGPLTYSDVTISDIVKAPSHYQAHWKILANSFSQWLELVATSAGTCGYTFSINEVPM
jgi:hypothetical protein